MERGTKIFKRMLGVVLAIVMCMTLTSTDTNGGAGSVRIEFL